jgi:twinkle protein
MEGFTKAEDHYNEAIKLRTEGINEGQRLELGKVDDIYRVKQGCTTYITGIPGHGKTELHFEILIRLTKLYNWKHLLESPETGTPARIVYELQRKLLNKPEQEASDTDWEQAFNIVNNHFFLLDSEKKDLDTIHECIDNTLLETRLNTFSIDPWNELEHNFEAYGGRQDIYLAYQLGKLRKKAEKYKLHIFIVIHPHQLKKNPSGSYDAPTIYNLAGGAEWANKAQTIMCCYREKIVDENGNINNEMKVIIQKAKPKEVGLRGEESIYYDKEIQRFYYKDELNKTIYP